MTNTSFPRVLGDRLNDLKFLLLGTCSTGAFADAAARQGFKADHYLYDGRFDNPLPKNAAEYDATVVGLTLRYIVDDAGVQGNDLWYFRLGEQDQLEKLLENACKIIDDNLARLQKTLPGNPIFYVAFLEQSFNAPGTLLPRYSLKNPTYFVQKLNEHLANSISSYGNAYFVDTNELAAWVGTGSIQDDKLSSTLHANYLSDWDFDNDKSRIATPTPVSQIFGTAKPLEAFNDLLWTRLADNLKTIRKIDTVKIAIVDLDDTMWRGIAAEDDTYNHELLEGWPIGFVEALLYFKNRGGLLAICSKNDHDRTVANFKKIWGDKITLDDFASVKINWQPKSENVMEILREVNLLPESAIIIDDNPRELDEICGSVSGIRALGLNHYNWRRIILQAPEMQVEKITQESQDKTALIRALQERESARATLSRDEWLASLNVSLSYYVVTSTDSTRFPRLLELLNKTNQFNTTGKRWTMLEIEKFFADGGEAVLVSSKDRTAENGIILVCLIAGDAIVQMVMSCRVFGLGIEQSVARVVKNIISERGARATAALVDTGKNFSCHNYFSDVGFIKEDNRWVAENLTEHPGWIKHDYVESGSLAVVGEPTITASAGREINLVAHITNNSETAWVSDGSQINIAYHIYSENGDVIVHDGIRSPGWSILKPKETLAREVKVLAPETSGNYTVKLVPVHEGKKWFADDKFSASPISLTVV